MHVMVPVSYTHLRVDCAVMTNIGIAHIEQLGSQERILEEKLHIQAVSYTHLSCQVLCGQGRESCKRLWP